MVVWPVRDANAEVESTVRVKLVPLRAETVPLKPCSSNLILSALTKVALSPDSFSLSTSTRCALLMVVASKVGNDAPPPWLLCTANLVPDVIGTVTVRSEEHTSELQS